MLVKIVHPPLESCICLKKISTLKPYSRLKKKKSTFIRWRETFIVKGMKQGPLTMHKHVVKIQIEKKVSARIETDLLTHSQNIKLTVAWQSRVKSVRNNYYFISVVSRYRVNKISSEVNAAVIFFLSDL